MGGGQDIGVNYVKQELASLQTIGLSLESSPQALCNGGCCSLLTRGNERRGEERRGKHMRGMLSMGVRGCGLRSAHAAIRRRSRCLQDTGMVNGLRSSFVYY